MSSKRVRLQALDQVLHAAGFELEDGRRLAALQQRVRRRVVHRQRGHVERRLAGRRAPGVDRAHGPVDDRERAQAEEVELDEARGFDVVLVELRDDAGAALFAIERREVRQHRRRDDDAARVRAGVAHQAFERARHVDQLAHVVFVLVALAQLLFLVERVVERDAEFERDQLGDAVGEPVAQALHARDVAHDRLRRHGAVGDDLRDALAPVALRDVIDDPVAAFHAEVDVEVGHRHALGVQETLEQQVVVQRVEVGDAERVRHERAGARTTARPDRHAVLARPADEVRDDQEVARESHLADDVEFAGEAALVFVARDVRAELGGDDRPALLEPELRLLAQVLLGRLARRHRVGRQRRLAELDLEVEAARDLDGVLERLGQVGEERRHLVGRAQVLLFAVASRARRIGDHRAFVDADAGFVRFEILGPDEAHVVGRDDRHAEA